jgi:hypothetical protein
VTLQAAQAQKDRTQAAGATLREFEKQLHRLFVFDPFPMGVKQCGVPRAKAFIFLNVSNKVNDQQVRAALLIDRQDTFFGSVRTTTVLDLVMSPALKTSPPPSYLTGMFLAQCKLVISQPLRAALQCRGRAHDRCRRAIDGRAASDGDAPGDQPSGIGEQKAARYAT